MQAIIEIASVVIVLLQLFVRTKGQKALDAQKDVSKAVSKLSADVYDTSAVSDLLK